MKKLVFSVLFAFGAFTAMQAQTLYILFVNNTNTTWTYNVMDANGTPATLVASPYSTDIDQIAGVGFNVTHNASAPPACSTVYGAAITGGNTSNAHAISCSAATFGRKLSWSCVPINGTDFFLTATIDI